MKRTPVLTIVLGLVAIAMAYRVWESTDQNLVLGGLAFLLVFSSGWLIARKLFGGTA